MVYVSMLRRLFKGLLYLIIRRPRFNVIRNLRVIAEPRQRKRRQQRGHDLKIY